MAIILISTKIGKVNKLSMVNKLSILTYLTPCKTCISFISLLQLAIFLLCISSSPSSIYWTGPFPGIKSPIEACALHSWGEGSVCSLKTVDIKTKFILKR